MVSRRDDEADQGAASGGGTRAADEDVRLSRLTAGLAGRYAIEREVGRGGWSVVYRAKDLKHDRLVAIKVLRPEIAASVGVERFLREIEIAAKLQHPHILPVYDSGDAGGVLYYVMPFVEGESLREHLERTKGLPVDEALTIAREVASALSYAHGHGVVHRDIKPANILLSGGHAVVADFGIARALRASGPGLTEVGMAIGTPQYMSPEQVVGSEDIDGRSDLYSLGCVLYEMLVGEVPFDGPTAQAIMAGRFSDPKPRIASKLRGRVPTGIQAALTTALDQDASHRYQTGADFARALTTAQPREPLAQRLGPVGVVGLYLTGAVVVLAITSFLVRQLGLPGWALVGVIVLLAGGLPVATALVLLERSHRPASGRSWSWLTWRSVLRGGVVALGGWSLVVIAYMGMRVLGIGAVGTLVASGALDRGQRVVLADFVSQAGDTLLAAAVTEALRIDLAQSRVVAVVDRDNVTRVLARMERTSSRTLDAALAREVAIRDGISAVISGEILSVGAGYVVSARVTSAESGAELAALRETAHDSTDLIAAVDRLSKKLRSRIGESIKSIRASEPLAQVTTGSLEALQRYSQAQQAARDGDPLRARTLLQEAVALDTAFAMAYRRLGTLALSRGEQVGALTKAFQHRDRLPARERYLTEGTYYSGVTSEREKAIQAYRSVLDVEPGDWTAANNLGGVYNAQRDYERAEEIFLDLIAGDSANPTAYQNAIAAQVARGRLDEARATLGRFEANMPGHPTGAVLAANLAAVDWRYDTAAARFRELGEAHRGELVWRINAAAGLASVALAQGRLAEAERFLAAVVDDASQLGLPAFSLRMELEGATFDLLFRDDVEGALRRVKTALDRFPLDRVDPLDRPYAELAGLYAFAQRPDLAKAALAEFDSALAPELRRAAAPSRHTLVGLIALSEGRADAAIPEFRSADDGSCAMCVLPLLGLAYDHAGRPDSAIAVWERFLATPWIGRLNVDLIWLGRVYDRLGELYAERGESEKAIAYSARLVALWQDADPEFQSRVAAARTRLSELTTEQPPP